MKAATVTGRVITPRIRGRTSIQLGELIPARLRRAAGQLQGVIAMIEEGRCCTDVLDQLSAARRAVDEVGLLVLEDHAQSCVRRAIATGDAGPAADVSVAVRRYVRSQ